MAYGGGIFSSFDKDLLGVYFRSIEGSALRTQNRGFVGMIMQDLGWSPEGVYSITSADFNRDGRYMFLANTRTEAAFMPLREVMRNANVAFVFNTAEGGTKASNTFATAKYTGSRGNNLTVVISQGLTVDTYDVELKAVIDGVLETLLIHRSITSLAGLPSNNFVDWKESATLAVTAGMPLTLGVDKTPIVDFDAQFLSEVSNYDFNVIVYASADPLKNQAFCEWVKESRDFEGRFFQGVTYNVNSNLASIYSVSQHRNLCYWVAGLAAKSGMRETIAAIPYDGEHKDLITNYSAYQMRQATLSGQLIFHDMERGINPEATVFAIYDEVTNLVAPSNYEPRVLKSGHVFRVRDIIRRWIRATWFAKYAQKVQYLAARNGIRSDVAAYFDELKNDVIEPVPLSEIIAEEPPETSDMDENMRKRSTYLQYPLSVRAFAGILYVTEVLY